MRLKRLAYILLLASLMMIPGCGTEDSGGIKTTALLGDYFQFSLSCEDLVKSLEFYRNLHYTIISVREDATPPWALISDGSNTLTLSQHNFPSPTLTFYGQNMSARLNALKKREIPYESIENDQGNVQSAIINYSENLGITLINFASGKLPRPAAAPEFILGNFQELKIYGGDPSQSKLIWQKFGFEEIASGLTPPSSLLMVHPLIRVHIYPSRKSSSSALSYQADNFDAVLKLLEKSEIVYDLDNISPDQKTVEFYSPDGQLFVITGPSD